MRLGLTVQGDQCFKLANSATDLADGGQAARRAVAGGAPSAAGTLRAFSQQATAPYSSQAHGNSIMLPDRITDSHPRRISFFGWPPLHAVHARVAATHPMTMCSDP